MAYKGYLTANGNVMYNCTQDLKLPTLDPRIVVTKNNNQKVYQGYESNFVDYANGDYRVLSASKARWKVSNEVPDENFDMNSIGIQSDYQIEDRFMNFDLTYPADNISIGNTSTRLAWSKSRMADEYKYEVSESEDFSNLIASGTTKDNEVEINSLNENKEYYWKVTAINNSRQLGRECECSEVFRFTTSGEILVESVTYSKLNDRVSYKIKNTMSSGSENVNVVVALKDTNGKLLKLDKADVTLDAGQSIEKTFSTKSFNGNNGAKLEVYFWNMDNMSIYAERQNFSYTK